MLIYFNLKSKKATEFNIFCMQTMYFVDWYVMFEGTFNVHRLLFNRGLNLFVMCFKRRFLRFQAVKFTLYDAANLTNFGHFQTFNEFY